MSTLCLINWPVRPPANLVNENWNVAKYGNKLKTSYPKFPTIFYQMMQNTRIIDANIWWVIVTWPLILGIFDNETATFVLL